MTTVRQEQEREELHRTIWAIADELRGSIDGWDFKSYVLGMMFYRYLSEKFTHFINQGEHEAGNDAFDYAEISDAEAEADEEVKKDLIRVMGFFIRPSQLFWNVLKNIDDKEDAQNNVQNDVQANQENDDEKNEKIRIEQLNEKLNKTFANIEGSTSGTKSEGRFAGLFQDLNVDSNKLGNDVLTRNKKLKKIMDCIARMKFGNYADHSIDAFGDAYEYLMAMYASNAGKSGGEFFTPQDVSELLARLALSGKAANKKSLSIYDPACGSGSLLLKAKKLLDKDSTTVDFYGQEINLTTYNLCRINMFLHNVGFENFDIAYGDTLIKNKSWINKKDGSHKTFDVIVSNPPYSIKWEGDDNGALISDSRYSPAGVLAPKSKADLAFVMHSLAYLAPTGTASIVCFPGIMYRGGAEKKIRQYLIEWNFIDTIIQLPPNLFFGTTIATCIMVLKKSKADNNVLFIDASKEFIKITNNNRLTEENIAHIVDVFEKRQSVDHLAQCVSNEDIRAQDYNLSVSTYVTPEDTRERVDIVQLNAHIQRLVANENQLRQAIDTIIREIEG